MGEWGVVSGEWRSGEVGDRGQGDRGASAVRRSRTLRSQCVAEPALCGGHERPRRLAWGTKRCSTAACDWRGQGDKENNSSFPPSPPLPIPPSPHP
ncbi:hypothetical protein, partial [Tolypothrix sp. VBCCA 56010]|uniref:hypothetical protein n=1 Tax=Tolypothrix sp. VBCCA 56010 TaxID=3137731 RepID=UPI003D7E1289